MSEWVFFLWLSLGGFVPAQFPSLEACKSAAAEIVPEVPRGSGYRCISMKRQHQVPHD